MSAKASLSATNLAVHHHHSCDLYLHNVYHRPRHEVTTPREALELTEARFKRGIDWEKHLFTWLDRNNLLLTVPSTPLDPETLYENIQADDRDHFFIAGLSFMPPQEMFNRRFREIGQEPVNFSLAKPDLLEIWRSSDSIKWKVIDVKVSSKVKTSHHAQIYFYTMCLAHIFPGKYFTPEGSTGIWLPPSEGFDKCPPSFNDLKSIETHLLSSSLDQFFFERLPDIIHSSVEDTKWHYNPQCRGCPYETECKTSAVNEGRFGSMPNISLEEVGTLKGLLRASAAQGLTQTQPLTDIEDLHRLVSEPSKLNQLATPFPGMVRRGKRILAMSNKSNRGMSPVVEAARTQRPQVKLRRSLTLPYQEDVAVVMSFVCDFSSPSPSIERYAINVISQHPLPIPATTLQGPGSDLVPLLALLISTITAATQSASPPSGLTTQFYVWSAREQSILQSHLITTALTAVAHDHEVRVCIGALAQGASLLQTVYQPVLLSGALLNFLTNSQRTTAEHVACLERMGLPTDGSAADLRKRVDEEIRKLQFNGGLSEPASLDSVELGQVPRVVVLRREVENLIALPVPGYWDLSDSVSVLLLNGFSTAQCPTDEDILNKYRYDTQALGEGLERRNASIYAVLQNVRQRIVDSGHRLLVNKAKVLSSNFMDLCRQEQIRKLFFAQQFEVLAKLNELWRARIEGCPDAPVLKYLSPRLGARGMEHVFQLESGTLDMPTADKNTAMYDKIIVPDEDSDPLAGDEVPVEALFDDLAVSGLVFPLNKNTRSKWSAMHPAVQNKLLVANLLNIVVDGDNTNIVLHAWGSQGVKFIPGCKYRISPRLVDFNTSKAMSALLETDLRWASAPSNNSDHRDIPFLQMILNPSSFGRNYQGDELVKTESTIQKMFRELNDLGVEGAGALILKSSQHRAAQRILSNRLCVIWGPPGTGKTYTIALSLFRLLDARQRRGESGGKVIFVTAMTHAAIDAVRKELLHLVSCYRHMESLPTAWLDRVSVEQVLAGRTHPAPQPGSPLVHIYLGTTYQLYNFTKQHTGVQAECVVFDEAGQLALSSIALVLRALSPRGQVIVAGDSEQLAPILSAEYPQVKGRPIFGSVLDCLMYKPPGQAQTQTQTQTQWHAAAPAPPVETQESESYEESINSRESTTNVVQLTENFRLNPDLGAFVSTIYSRAFKPQKSQTRQLARSLQLAAAPGPAPAPAPAGPGLGVGVGVGPSPSSSTLAHAGIPEPITRAVQTMLLGLARVMLREPQSVLQAPRHRDRDGREGTLAPAPAPTVQGDPDAGAGAGAGPRALSLALVRLDADSGRVRAGARTGAGSGSGSGSRGAGAGAGDVAYETHVRGEAAVAAALVCALRRCAPQDDIFVATPHRVQREAVKSALAMVERAMGGEEGQLVRGVERMRIGPGESGSGSDEEGQGRGRGGEAGPGRVKVDTIERLQGSEASFVICLFSVPKSTTSPDLGFLLERRRLNVAISRAKTMCVVVTSPNVLRPGVKVLANEETAKGYAFLRAFEERAWAYDMSVDLDAF